MGPRIREGRGPVAAAPISHKCITPQLIHTTEKQAAPWPLNVNTSSDLEPKANIFSATVWGLGRDLALSDTLSRISCREIARFCTDSYPQSLRLRPRPSLFEGGVASNWGFDALLTFCTFLPSPSLPPQLRWVGGCFLRTGAAPAPNVTRYYAANSPTPAPPAPRKTDGWFRL